MNLILLFEDDFFGEGNRVRLRGRRHEHVHSILQASVGDELCVGLCDGQIGRGRIIVIDETMLEMDVILNRDAPKELPVTLVLALPRPIVCRRVIASVSAMGVKRIFLFHSNRVEKSFWKSPVLQEENIKKQLILGLEQARDTILPQVQLRTLFKPFVEDELARIAKDTLALVAHPDTINSCPSNVQRPVTLVIGPEGGFIPYEIEKLMDIGFQPVQLGKRILRVDSFVPAILSKLF